MIEGGKTQEKFFSDQEMEVVSIVDTYMNLPQISPMMSQVATPAVTPRSNISPFKAALSEEFNDIMIVRKLPFVKIEKDFSYLENTTFQLKGHENDQHE